MRRRVNLFYLLPRLVRHFLPELAVRFLLHRSPIIRPGLETRAPQEAVARYLAALEQAGIAPKEKRVMIFGYGGSFAVGCGLLRAGAGHVMLVDAFASPDDRRNRALMPKYKDYLVHEGNTIHPRPEVLTLIQADIRKIVAEKTPPPVDLVLSSSVYEHLDDGEGITHALATLTRPGGVQLHFVDLRDHFFKYPFEMLTFSETVWRLWLNPTAI